MKKRIFKLLDIFCLIFLIIALYLSWTQILAPGKYRDSSLNPRNRPELKFRGSIYDGKGRLLAYTEKGARLYPLGEAASPLIGFANQRLGTEGLEYYCNQELSGKRFPSDFSETGLFLRGGTLKGRNIYLTLDSELQLLCYRLLRGKQGAIVVSRPSSGEILAMASSPGYDPMQVSGNWQSLKESAAAPLLNRCTEGLYPPGSVFKIFTLAAALETGQAPDYFQCSGRFSVGDYTIYDSDNAVHGKISLQQALALSCNGAFGRMALSMGGDEFIHYAEEFHLLKKIHFSEPDRLTVAPCTIEKDPYAGELAQNGFGQGKLLATPMHICLITQSVAAGGTIMRPMLVKSMESPVKTYYTRQEILCRPLSEETARRCSAMMVAAVEEGTGKQAAVEGIRIAGKTGTAENPHGDPHAWFTGFAPAERPEITVTVVVENGGYGAEAAAPIAARIFRRYLKDGTAEIKRETAP